MLFFFFQAEDGIRDLTVTGVQTCALPILNTGSGLLGPMRPRVRWVERTAPIPGTAPRAPNTVTRSPSSCWSNSGDRKSTRLNSSHSQISYAVFCLKKKKKQNETRMTDNKS